MYNAMSLECCACSCHVRLATALHVSCNVLRCVWWVSGCTCFNHNILKLIIVLSETVVNVNSTNTIPHLPPANANNVIRSFFTVLIIWQLVQTGTNVCFWSAAPWRRPNFHRTPLSTPEARSAKTQIGPIAPVLLSPFWLSAPTVAADAVYD